METTILEITKELFELIGVNTEVKVEKVDEETYTINLLTTSETGLLIGFRGENINSIQTILSLIVKNKTGNWYRLVVNVGDYREKQQKKLEDLADQVVDRVLETGEPQPIYNLNSSQRRIIHMYLSKRKDLVTESQGEGEERFLIVKQK